MNCIPMNCEISQTFFFDAAHTLDRVIDTESSKRVHGHTYNAEVFLSGLPDPHTGMLMDLGLVRRKSLSRPRLSRENLSISVSNYGFPRRLMAVPRCHTGTHAVEMTIRVI